jgi:hypothetical protein
VATPRKLWETNVGLRPATHIMSTFVCLAIEANPGLTQKEMGVILGVSHTTVGQALKKINFTRKHTLMKNETRKSDNNLSR